MMQRRQTAVGSSRQCNSSCLMVRLPNHRQETLGRATRRFNTLATSLESRMRASCTSSHAVMSPTELDEVLQRVKQQFDSRAAEYEQNNTYHPLLAQRLLPLCELKAGHRLLDLACGTGLISLPAAAAVGPSGFIAAVDISQAMLDQASSKYTASLQLQQQANYPQQQQQLAPIQFIQGNIENLNRCLSQEWLGSFDAVTCSAAVPFLRHPEAAIQHWRQWLKPGSGKLVLNTFESIEDFRVYCELVRQFGLQEVDPCERLGSVDRTKAALQNAGYHHIEITPELVERWYPATSIADYAERIFQVAQTNNPFGSPNRLQQLGSKQEAFHDAFVAKTVEAVQSARRHDAAGNRVLSRHTV